MEQTYVVGPQRKRGAPRKLSQAKERRVVLAYYEGKLKVEAIAGRFGISRTAVYDMVHRNPQIAEEYLEELGRQMQAQQAEIRKEVA